jgi:hypothetical protein
VSASSGVVFVATTLVASPVFLLLHQDSITLEDAVKRLLLCAAVCWIAISIVSSLAWSPSREAPSATDPVEGQAPRGPGTPAAT